jgi:hypothetical protein
MALPHGFPSHVPREHVRHRPQQQQSQCHQRDHASAPGEQLLRGIRLNQQPRGRHCASSPTAIHLIHRYTKPSPQLGTVTFPNKANYIFNLLAAPPVPSFQTFAIFHDCWNIAWRWQINGLGGIPIKGINAMAANPLTGQLSVDYLEFNSIAWGRDVGWTCTPPQS